VLKSILMNINPINLEVSELAINILLALFYEKQASYRLFEQTLTDIFEEDNNNPNQ